VSSLTLAGGDVATVIETAKALFGPEFVRVLDVSRVWVNGEDATRSTPIKDCDEIAVIPPVSGG
jgi:molybdopterin converting factor small subunit